MDGAKATKLGQIGFCTSCRRWLVSASSHRWQVSLQAETHRMDEGVRVFFWTNPPGTKLGRCGHIVDRETVADGEVVEPVEE